MNPRLWLLAAALLGATGVGIGAYHAHGLEKSLRKQGLSDEVVSKRLEQCEVAVRYQIYHALALLGVGLLALRAEDTNRGLWLFTGAALFFLLGVTLFSGGLYLFVFAGNGIHWSIVPLGGLALIVGWLVLAIASIVPKQPQALSK